MVLVRLKQRRDATSKSRYGIKEGEEIVSCNDGHRCGLPFVLTEDDGAAPLPTGLPFELNRALFGTFASPASLITIFA